jgi:hypothetical protein
MGSNYAFLQYVPSKDLSMFMATDLDTFNLVVDGSECIGKNCIEDENIISTIIPNNFKVLKVVVKEGLKELPKKSYTLRVEGNTYTAYTKKVKGATMILTLQKNIDMIYSKLQEDVNSYKDIEIDKDGQNIKLDPISKQAHHLLQTPSLYYRV